MPDKSTEHERNTIMLWKTINTTNLIQTHYVSVNRSTVQLPDGMTIPDFYTVTIPDASGVVALTSDNKILLKTEYRYSQQTDLIELPAGTFEEDENDPLAVAKRELLEETGYESSDWTYLGATVESSSKLTNQMHLFLAKNCVRVCGQHLDIAEHLDVMLVDLKTAVDMVMRGEIRCNSSAHAILMAARMMEI